MIKANELRIGNWVTVKGVFEKAIHIRLRKHDFNKDFNDFYPIPLTEEILLKCGFENYQTDKSNVFKGEGFLITFVKEGRFKGKRYLKYHCVTFEDFGKIQYLHQLQNLYWCLCGKEVEVNF